MLKFLKKLIWKDEIKIKMLGDELHFIIKNKKDVRIVLNLNEYEILNHGIKYELAPFSDKYRLDVGVKLKDSKTLETHGITENKKNINKYTITIDIKILDNNNDQIIEEIYFNGQQIQTDLVNKLNKKLNLYKFNFNKGLTKKLLDEYKNKTEKTFDIDLKIKFSSELKKEMDMVSKDFQSLETETKKQFNSILGNFEKELDFDKQLKMNSKELLKDSFLDVDQDEEEPPETSEDFDES